MIDIGGSELTGDGAVAFCGELIGGEGGVRGVVDCNEIEVDGIGDGAAVAVSDEVVETCDAVEVVVGSEGVLVVISVVSELTVGDGEVLDVEVVNIA